MIAAKFRIYQSSTTDSTKKVRLSLTDSLKNQQSMVYSSETNNLVICCLKTKLKN